MKNYIGVDMFEFRKTTCHHDKILPNMEAGYCPDCGEYVKNEWVVTRCACCGTKQKTLLMRGKVTADVKFCRNCGCDSFVEQKLDEIDIVNINYAVVVKKTLKPKRKSFVQTWVEEAMFVQVKLLPSY